MGASEVEAVRAFCVFVRAAGCGVRWLSDAPDEQVRSMLEVGRVIGKMTQGMTAAAIATPSGSVIVRLGADGIDGPGTTVEAPEAEPVVGDGRGRRFAIVLYNALVAAGGPVEPLRPATMTAEEADALAGWAVGLLRNGRTMVHFGGGVEVEQNTNPAGWLIRKGDGLDGHVLVAPDSWDLLRSELARLLAE